MSPITSASASAVPDGVCVHGHASGDDLTLLPNDDDNRLYRNTTVVYQAVRLDVKYKTFLLATF